MKKTGSSFLLLILVAGSVVMFMLRRGGAAAGGADEAPPAFAEHLSLAGAQSRAGAGKPVLAFATANWCPPCKEMKRTTLRDARVTEWILQNTVPAYVDIDKDPAAAAQLNVVGIPAMVLMRDGVAIAKNEGYVDAERFLAWGADALHRATPAR